MLLRKYTRTKAGKQYCYYALVESVRTAADRGDGSSPIAANSITNSQAKPSRGAARSPFTTARARLASSASFPTTKTCRSPTIPISCAFAWGDVGWTNARRFGDLWLGLQLWRMLHLDDILNRQRIMALSWTPAAATILRRSAAPNMRGPFAERALRSTFFDGRVNP